jgi:two-component system, NtrC family, sensor histidine kinase KinB
MQRSASQLTEYLIALTAVAVAAGTATLLQRVLPLPDPAMVFLAGVLCAAVLCGLGPSILAAVTSVLVYDFFFVAPLYTLRVTAARDVVSLIVFLVVAVLTSNLTTRARDQAAAARRRDVALDEKAKTEAVIEAIEDGLIVLDPAGVVVHINDLACAILEVERTAVLGHDFEGLATRHPHYLRLRAAVREFLAHPEREEKRVEITLFLRGRDHHFVVRPTPFRAPQGAHAGLILALQDVTYLRDQEGRREALVATLSHELRTPITSLSMALELLRRDGQSATEEQVNLLEAAQEDVARLQDVAQRLLDLSRARAMTIALDRRSVDLRGVVARVVKIFGVQARDKGIALRATLPEQDLGIVGDEIKLTWALSNLLSNAFRYTPAGGRVDIEARVGEDSVLIAVGDTGPGIPAAQRERIFEPFVQAADGGEIGSAGLGLAIVRDIVQAHGGRIHLDTEVGHGSRFTLELPRE